MEFTIVEVQENGNHERLVAGNKFAIIKSHRQRIQLSPSEYDNVLKMVLAPIIDEAPFVDTENQFEIECDSWGQNISSSKLKPVGRAISTFTLDID